MTPLDTARRALACLDLTDLSDTASPEDMARLTTRAATPFGNVAAICIWPQFVSAAAQRLRGSNIRIATVINFPAGDEDIERSVSDAREALRDGAHEIDLVLPWRAFLRNETALAHDMIAAVTAFMTNGRLLKVILETGCLAQDDMIARASRLAIDAGAHFIKTSTGKTPVSATPQAARIMLNAIRESGRAIGFKASGGIRTLTDAKTYLDLADEIMGPGWLTPATFRIGASGFLDALLEELKSGGQQ
jgi:deoxyribose-phosphate aldolase